MIQRILVVTMLILISACATSGPVAPEPEVKAALASVDNVAPGNSAASSPADFQNLEVPDTTQAESASAEIASAENDPDELICRRERETGSKFTTKVCRTRAEIEAREAQDQEILRTMRKIDTGSECALNGNC